MRITINSLGPLHDTSLDFSSPITVLFGRSNSGKSFVLKAIYSSLSFLDKSNNIELASLSIPYFRVDSPKEVYLDIPVNLKLEELIGTYRASFVGDADYEINIGKSSIRDIMESATTMLVRTEFKQVKRVTPVICPDTGYSIEMRMVKGVLNIVAKNYDRVNDEEACMGALSREVRQGIIFYLSREVIGRIFNSLGVGLGLPSVRFISYGRFLKLLGGTGTLRTPWTGPRYFRSSSYWISRNLNTLDSVNEEIAKLFGLNLEVRDRRLFVNGHYIMHSSASLVEMSSIYLSLADSSGGLVLIEEPESQLDIYNQVRMALILYNLSQRFRLIITTHSEVILLTLAMLSQYHSCLKDIHEFSEEFDIGIPLGEPTKVNFYFVKDGKLHHKTSEEILENDEIFLDVNRRLLKVNSALYEKWSRECQEKEGKEGRENDH
ncbi:hypothetical protein L3N51_01475 [Metallosphaera sp. J1]|uniref:AAA family ATPase n=1 Tax=Metallosphaera TaxID=41980 RepID=UPI001EDD8CCF|nr:AAA family ATPase [Metallosphaera javensis (ex Hofmann et al. 2022)]MCG3109185.1 hypothetical protein [Metallosphaera javensis (ex Hofmann et al. 2022)]BCS93341.1 MAG: hypothetical protein MjAS7_1949 [Metallosphaera javensis (ex Sakai et al. 2022)]